MCRITGFLDSNRPDYDLCAVIVAMRDTMTHGGPDDSGSFVDQPRGLALGHRRLSILDLSPAGRQPMAGAGGAMQVVYNGEIYNFREIRKELADMGHIFSTQTDTEVLLKAYQEWGLDCVQRFRGMFAFALWDSIKENLILCRDRVGVKPLYWYLHNGLFLFASELKALRMHPRFSARINAQALPSYFQFGCIRAPLTIYEHCHKLEPGNFLILDREMTVKSIQYWNPAELYVRGLKQRESAQRRSMEDLADELEEIMTESFRLRLVSDVPVGVFLSGGVDSALVTALLRDKCSTRLRTFTIGFGEPEFDESSAAAATARLLDTDHTCFQCSPSDIFGLIKKLPDLYDEPFADSSCLPTHLVAALARKSVKVALSADGGDEQFCGYDRLTWSAGFSHLRFIPGPVRSLVSRFGSRLLPLARLLHNRLPAGMHVSNFREKYRKLLNTMSCSDAYEALAMCESLWPPSAMLHLLKRIPDPVAGPALPAELCRHDLLSSLMLTDLLTYLPDDILVKVDRATMAVGLEAREPLLDHRILEFSACLPPEFKFHHGVRKYLLKKVLYRHLPERMFQRPKQGFGIPVHDWFRTELKPLYDEYLSPERLSASGCFNVPWIRKQLEQYYSGRPSYAHGLWAVFVYQLWLERWMSGK
ncbi:MAG: asparagine synthase (glutamine-hydrolyzing) [Candidatus Wallbacteria bacterium]|nr:asparagine synthase (glutamine-hydrolyzing) [Candidatus Wallbacteria bacterium]